MSLGLLALSLPPGSSCTAKVPQGQQSPFHFYLGAIWEFVQRFGVIKQWGGAAAIRYLGDKDTCQAKRCNSQFQAIFCRTALYSSTVICRTGLCQPPGAGLAMPVEKSIHLPWEKAAEVPMALSLWLNFTVSNWRSLDWPGIQFWSTDLSPNHGVERDH